MASLTDEQSLLKDSAQGWVQSNSPVEAFRRIRDQGSELGFEPEAWKQMVELGWASVVIPEEFGGVDLGYLSLGLILEQLGRTLTASPLIPSAAAGVAAISLGGSHQHKEELLPAIAEGSTIATLAVDEGARHKPTNVTLSATAGGDSYILSGSKSMVIEGIAADLLIVSARVLGADDDPDGIELFLVPTSSDGISRTRLSLIDGRGATNIESANVQVPASSRLEGGANLLEKVLDRTRACVCAEMLGMCTQAFETTVEYLKTRVQFDHVIGSFQALQHRAAKMLTEIELSRSAVEAALSGIDANVDNVPELVSIAKAKMGDTLHLVTNEMIQMHGGIGMTDEHDAGLYIKRARATAALYGNQAFHRERYARLMGY
jgi:alkylation response protein AidB-like acyl-CoA dehydrogenase